MKPRDLLCQNLEENVSPYLRSQGFTFSRAQISFLRKQDFARQEIHFSLSKWNTEDDCSFWTMWGVSSTAYTKWHLQEWGEKPVNNALGGCADWNIPGWPRQPGDEHFKLTRSRRDIDVMKLLVDAIGAQGLPYLQQISTWSGAAQQFLKEGWMFGKACDFFLIAGQRDRAIEALYLGLDKYELQGAPDQLLELPQIKARLEKYKKVDVSQ